MLLLLLLLLLFVFLFFFFFFSEVVDKASDSKEISNNNKSLQSLANVIRECSEKKKDKEGGIFVNYRSSNLTRLLKNSLGGNSKTLIIATISILPSDIGLCSYFLFSIFLCFGSFIRFSVTILISSDATFNTLEMVSRARTIENNPIINQQVTSKNKIRDLQEENRRLNLMLLDVMRRNGNNSNSINNNSKNDGDESDSNNNSSDRNSGGGYVFIDCSFIHMYIYSISGDYSSSGVFVSEEIWKEFQGEAEMRKKEMAEMQQMVENNTRGMFFFTVLFFFC
jgi:hypothetical protein